jgi:hypothetical protein
METRNGKHGTVNTMRKRTQRSQALESDILDNVSGLSYRERKRAKRMAHARFKRLGKAPSAKSKKNLHHMKLDNTYFKVSRNDRTGKSLRNKDTLSRAYDASHGHNTAWLDTCDRYQKDSIVTHCKTRKPRIYEDDRWTIYQVILRHLQFNMLHGIVRSTHSHVATGKPSADSRRSIDTCHDACSI